MIEHISIPEDRLKLLKSNNAWRDELKKFVDVEIDVNEDVTINGEALQVIRVKEMIKAFGRGFDFKNTFDLLDEQYYLEILNIGEFIGKSRDRQITVRGRLIGENGKTKKAIEKYALVKLVIYGKTVAVIGKHENIRIAREAIRMILSGSKHNTVYRFLQENKVV